tara:strand:- start:128 stop:307 length:180 start_codon:yes stop_codon:yes gene_type:complete
VKDGKSYGEKALWQAFSLFLSVFSLFLNPTGYAVISVKRRPKFTKSTCLQMAAHHFHKT